MDELEVWLEKVYEAGGDRRTLEELYDGWARDYDQHIWASGNPYIAVATGFAGRYISSFESSILDAGCGTGNMAQILHQMGYQCLHGLEPSGGMLEVARRKGFYQQLHQLALSAQIDLPNESYDAIVALGVLTVGHAPPESLDGMLKLLKPGGPLIFSLAKMAYEEHGFKEHMTALETAGKMTALDRSQLFRTYPFSEKEAHIHHWVFVFGKC